MMGTSSSYSGPTGKTPLLPPWADDPVILGASEAAGPEPNIPLELNIALPQVSWQVPKAALSRLARGVAAGLGVAALAPLVRSYVQASGGASTAAHAALAGRASTARLGGFLADGVQNGFQEAARHVGLEPFLGKDADYVLSQFIDLIASDGALREEAIARAAIIDTCTELFDQYDVAGEGIEAFNAMDADGIRAIVALSIANYVNERLQEELVNRIERGMLGEDKANETMDYIKDFIRGLVQLDLAEYDVLTLDWGGAEGQRVVERIYETGYELLGGAE